MTRRIGGGTLVIATHNAGKLKEIGALLAPYGLRREILRQVLHLGGKALGIPTI